MLSANAIHENHLSKEKHSKGIHDFVNLAVYMVLIPGARVLKGNLFNHA